MRAGNTLVELIVALPIAALLGTVAMGLLLDTHRLARRLQSTTEIARELRQAGAVLTSELRPLTAANVIAWTDTSFEMHAVVGSGVVCASPAPNIIDMMPLGGNDALRTAWFAEPQPGDNVWVTASDTTLMPATARWEMFALSSIAATSVSTCTSRALFTNGFGAGSRPIRLTLSAGANATPHAGTIVRITQRARYSLYKASDNLWYLGRKSLGPTGWSTIQPVAGPLDSPPKRGLLVQVRDSVENTFNFGVLRTPHSVALKLRASTQWLQSASKPGVIDSVLVHVALRGQPQ
ncbi:MAG: type II secretion system protein [Gemmatimonadaceae bacterium]